MSRWTSDGFAGTAQVRFGFRDGEFRTPTGHQPGGTRRANRVTTYVGTSSTQHMCVCNAVRLGRARAERER